EELPEGKVRLHPQDEVGLLDLDEIIGEADGSTQIYCCGPESLLRAVEDRCRGLRPDMLRVERFTPRQVEGAPDTAFKVICTLSDVIVDVPADKSVLNALREAGIDVSSSCQEGTCGTCETVVLAGLVEHRDSVLTPSEQAQNDCMMVCCSRGRS